MSRFIYNDAVVQARSLVKNITLKNYMIHGRRLVIYGENSKHIIRSHCWENRSSNHQKSAFYANCDIAELICQSLLAATEKQLQQKRCRRCRIFHNCNVCIGETPDGQVCRSIKVVVEHRPRRRELVVITAFPITGR